MSASGWGWPGNAKKAHYFVDGRSLCGRWLFFGQPTQNQGASSPDDCRECARRVPKERKP